MNLTCDEFTGNEFTEDEITSDEFTDNKLTDDIYMSAYLAHSVIFLPKPFSTIPFLHKISSK